MTKAHKGKFASKHPEGTKPDQEITQAIWNNVLEGALSCAAASKISESLGVSMADVGRNADLLDVRIHKCLYGLFGQATSTGEKVPIEPFETVSKEMKKAFDDKLENGCLTCAAGWEITDQMGLKLKSIPEICETLKIKIVRCQLGAF